MPLPTDGLAWRDGAGCIDPEASPAPSCELPDDVLDTLIDQDDAQPVHSIAFLEEQKRAGGDWTRFERVRAALPDADPQTLILRLGSATDPLTAWAIHTELDSRGIAPCLRWPANTSAPQMLFVTWLADVLWFAKRHRTHTAKFVGWQRLLQAEPASPAWCERAYHLFRSMRNQNLSSYGARGLALTEAQRGELMVHPTSRMARHRQGIQPAQFAAVREKLYSHAVAHPDLSGTHRPQDIAERHARLWRVYILSGKSHTTTAKNWGLLTGQNLKRQVVARRIDAIETVLAA